MYEIWLTLNVLWELAVDHWPWVAGAALLWGLLMVVALRGARTRWLAGLLPAALVGLVVAAFAFFVAPALTRSSLADMGYWLDWLALAGIAAGAGAAAAALAWPLFAVRAR